MTMQTPMLIILLAAATTHVAVTPHAAETTASRLQPTAADTTFAVRPTARLDVERTAGTVRIRSWNRNEVRVRDARRGDSYSIRNVGDVVFVSFPGSPGTGGDVEITVPVGFSVSIHGRRVTADIQGVQGQIVVSTTNGNVTVRGGGSAVNAETMNGTIVIEDVRGPVDVKGTNQRLMLTRVAGSVKAQSVNGAIVLLEMSSPSVEASTINGAIEYRGEIAGGGRYQFSSHNGTITVAVPPTANATVSATTVHGQFDVGFPVTIQPGGGDRRVSFTVGNGSARLDLESFNGRLRLIRP